MRYVFPGATFGLLMMILYALREIMEVLIKILHK